MSEPVELEQPPTDDGERGKMLFDMLGPASMELVRRFGEEQADKLLEEWAEMFVASFVISVAAVMLGQNEGNQE